MVPPVLIPSSYASRGRNARYRAPPAQTRTCGFPASGSSVALASARTFTVTRLKAQWLFPPVRLARVLRSDSVRHEFPLRTACFRGVLRHVAGFPNLRLLCPIRHPSTLALASLPDRSLLQDSTRAHAVSGLFTLTCPNAVNFVFSPRSGAFGASWVPRRIFSCMPRPDDSAGSPHPRHYGCFCVAFGAR